MKYMKYLLNFPYKIKVIICSTSCFLLYKIYKMASIEYGNSVARQYEKMKKYDKEFSNKSSKKKTNKPPNEKKQLLKKEEPLKDLYDSYIFVNKCVPCIDKDKNSNKDSYYMLGHWLHKSSIEDEERESVL